jgi:hypothetical protein
LKVVNQLMKKHGPAVRRKVECALQATR